MRPKIFTIIFITYVYTIDIPTMGSHRDNICFVIVIVLERTIFFMIDYGENDYLHLKMWAQITEN